MTINLQITEGVTMPVDPKEDSLVEAFGGVEIYCHVGPKGQFYFYGLTPAGVPQPTYLQELSHGFSVQSLRNIPSLCGNLDWELNYAQWCEVIGLGQTEYTMKLWESWRKLCEGVKAFDQERIDRLVLYYLTTRKEGEARNASHEGERG